MGISEYCLQLTTSGAFYQCQTSKESCMKLLNAEIPQNQIYTFSYNISEDIPSEIADIFKLRKKHFEELYCIPKTSDNLNKKYSMCPFCPSKFGLQDYTEKNFSLCKQVKNQFLCLLCELTFCDTVDLNQHCNETHQDHKDFEECFACGYCRKIFLSANTLKHHVPTHFTEEKKMYACNYCPKKYRNQRNLKEHILLLHTGDAPFACPFCPQRYTRKTAFDRHINGHQLEEAKKFICQFCAKRFKNKRTLQFHIYTHTGEKQFICDKCGAFCLSPSQLNQHRKRHEIKSWICDICSAVFSNLRNFNRHTYSHREPDNNSCNICGKKFLYPANLNRHIKRHTKPLHKCTECDKEFNNKTRLKYHMHSHKKEKLHVCNLCNKTFVFIKYLQRHEKVHCKYQSRDLECEQCNKMFLTKEQLSVHMKLHLGFESPYGAYGCDICQRRFAKNMLLKRHNKKQLPCEQCQEIFCTTRDLYNHRLKKHAIENCVYECTVCNEKFPKKYYLTKHISRAHSLE